MPPPSYGGALRTTLQATAAAYGYTLTTATTIAVLVTTHGYPDIAEVALFAAGGLVAFAILEGVVIAMDPDDDPVDGHDRPVADLGADRQHATVGQGDLGAVQHEAGGGAERVSTRLSGLPAAFARLYPLDRGQRSRIRCDPGAVPQL